MLEQSTQTDELEVDSQLIGVKLTRAEVESKLTIVKQEPVEESDAPEYRSHEDLIRETGAGGEAPKTPREWLGEGLTQHDEEIAMAMSVGTSEED